ncbi:hypothetical protein GGS20DRAFT_97986 [Poronia punctata]|nr:hypothetical protein GGS20DRAFT_97986 [Poronia punctata]
MTSRATLELKGVVISKETDGVELFLSMSSTAFLYKVPIQGATQNNLMASIRSKKLWLLPPGPCRLDLRLDLHQLGVCLEEACGFVEFIAAAICRFPLWSKLGVSVKVLDNGIQYQPGDDNPNIYLSVEQPDMSSALLSPPQAHTAQLRGLESFLRFEAFSRQKASVNQGRLGSMKLHREDASCLVMAALDVVFGIRQRFPTLKSCRIVNDAPSLLDIAPAIWNAHYLKATVSHTENFGIISSILASTASSQSPGLRRQVNDIIRSCPAPTSNDLDPNVDNPLGAPKSSIERRLWDLLRVTLKPTIGTSRKASGNPDTAGEIQYPKGRRMVEEENFNPRLLPAYQHIHQNPGSQQSLSYHDIETDKGEPMGVYSNQGGFGVMEEGNVGRNGGLHQWRQSYSDLQQPPGLVYHDSQSTVDTDISIDYSSQDIPDPRVTRNDELFETLVTTNETDYRHHYSSALAMARPNSQIRNESRHNQQDAG